MRLDMYTDGSYNKYLSSDTVTGGIAILENNNVLMVRKVSSKNPVLVKAQSQGAEIVAVIVGLTDACRIANGNKCEIHLYHDNAGLGEFLKGTWKATKDSTRLYIMMVKTILDSNNNVKLHLHKVVAHTGNRYNELVDKIAGGNIPSMYLACAEPEITL